MTQLRATAVSPDRGVTVVAGPGGSILGVEFRPEAHRPSVQALSRAVMTTLQGDDFDEGYGSFRRWIPALDSGADPPRGNASVVQGRRSGDHALRRGRQRAGEHR